jgi:hypothetical protein
MLGQDGAGKASRVRCGWRFFFFFFPFKGFVYIGTLESYLWKFCGGCVVAWAA